MGTMSGVAQAQSSVTLSGIVDGGIRYTDTSAGTTYSMANTGWYTSNRWLLTGNEDLGGGWVTYFRLESGFIESTGALNNTNNILFKRASYIGMRGPYGNLVVGNQFTVAHDVVYNSDPFNLLYPVLIPLSAATAGFIVNNDVKYITSVGGLTVRAENSFGGVTGNFNAASSRAVGAQYQWNWLRVGAAYSYRTVLSGTVYQPDNYVTAGAELTFGKLRLAGGYMNDNEDQNKPVADIRTLNYWGGATYDLSPSVRIGASCYITDLPNQHGKRTLGVASVTYALSKSTLLYAEMDYTKYAGSYITNTALNAQKVPHQLGAAIGINHSF
ncbi:porin [Paraburkholderia acidisoli]|uniref:Porin n=1 Tax=Paraburkholderia acidisoli TaxID=2571748 RepID=A0A7Z2GQI2_9BURK|nr:porin [Paraburkholderia acidisoli]QGZ66136.1 porin [Paraburkholderia acidisoli]